MTVITVGEAVQACLGPLNDETELRSTDGVLLGYFVPMSEAKARMYQDARANFDPDVIRKRASHAGPWLSTAEVLERIQTRESTQ